MLLNSLVLLLADSAMSSTVVTSRVKLCINIGRKRQNSQISSESVNWPWTVFGREEARQCRRLSDPRHWELISLTPSPRSRELRRPHNSKHIERHSLTQWWVNVPCDTDCRGPRRTDLQPKKTSSNKMSVTIFTVLQLVTDIQTDRWSEAKGSTQLHYVH